MEHTIVMCMTYDPHSLARRCAKSDTQGLTCGNPEAERMSETELGTAICESIRKLQERRGEFKRLDAKARQLGGDLRRGAILLLSLHPDPNQPVPIDQQEGCVCPEVDEVQSVLRSFDRVHAGIVPLKSSLPEMGVNSAGVAEEESMQVPGAARIEAAHSDQDGVCGGDAA